MIEQRLGVRLPDDFKELGQFFSGGSLGVLEFFDFKKSNALNIIDERIRLRKEMQLPIRYIFLAEPPEGIVLLDVYSSPSIIWCDANDISHINEEDFVNHADTWECFNELIWEMLAEEE